MRDFVLQLVHMLMREANGAVMSALRAVATDVQAGRRELFEVRELLQDYLEEPVELAIGDMPIAPRGPGMASEAPAFAMTPTGPGMLVRVRYRRPDGKDRVERIEFYRATLVVSFGARIICALGPDDVESVRRRFMNSR